MYNDTYFDYRDSVEKDFYEKEMQRSKENAVRAISEVVHFEAETFTKVLASSFLDENEDAIRLANKLNLGKWEFYAVLEDYESFKEVVLKHNDYLQEQELAQNF